MQICFLDSRGEVRIGEGCALSRGGMGEIKIIVYSIFLGTS